MRKFIQIVFISFALQFTAQTKFDSVNAVISSLPDDTVKFKIIKSFIDENRYNNPSQLIELAHKLHSLSVRLNYKPFISYRELADCYDLSANYEKAIFYYQKGQEIARNEPSPQREHELSTSYSDLALLYDKIGNYESAIKSEMNAIKYASVLNDKLGVSISHLNLGNYYFKSHDYRNAHNKYALAEKGFIDLGDSTYLSYVYNGYGSVYSDQKQYDKALTYFTKSYDLTRTFFPSDQLSIATALQNIGEMYGKMGKPELGVEKCLESAELFRQVGEHVLLYTAYYNAATLLESMGDLKGSNKYMKEYVRLKDSIFSEDTRKTIHEMSIRYESEKKEQENKLLEQENRNKEMAIYYTSGGLLLMLGLVFSVYHSNRLKTKANKELAVKNQIIHEQKHLVEEKQTEILDSISYAKRLQEAILPPLNLLQENFKNIFVFYQPKDIVAGDFYWMEKLTDEKGEYVFIAAADCTGHGVPGALVSVVCSNALNRAVHEFMLTEPGKILDKTRELVVHTFSKSEKNVRDGMDISLLSVFYPANGDSLDKAIISWAGANNPVYICRNSLIEEIKGDKYPVGAYITDVLPHFNTHSLKVSAGDKIFLFSDGLADQFGGPDNKKYKYKRLKEKLSASDNMPVAEQKNFIQQDLAEWQGSREQVDDILLIGIEI